LESLVPLHVAAGDVVKYASKVTRFLTFTPEKMVLLLEFSETMLLKARD
jgi:hypothetical protein